MKETEMSAAAMLKIHIHSPLLLTLFIYIFIWLFLSFVIFTAFVWKLRKVSGSLKLIDVCVCV